jgi:methylase of polypeptide subunit release factors
MKGVKRITPKYFNNYILRGCLRSVFYSPSDTDSLCRLINKAIEISHENFKKKSVTIADLGCGSCIPTIFLAEELRNKNIDFEIKAFDIDEDAIGISKKNIKKMTLKGTINIEKKDIFAFLREIERKKFELVVSNPPYIPLRLHKLNVYNQNVLILEYMVD